VTAPVEVGCSADRPAIVHGLSGYLSNYRPSPSTSDIGLSLPATMTPCPWRIVVGRGQRINLTLVDFATPRAATDVGRLGCLQYAVLTEHVRPPRTLRVCGGDRRLRHLHTSLSNVVDVHVTSGRHNDNVDADERVYFLLYYKGWLQRTINHWNALTQQAVDCNTVDSFKRCLDRYVIEKGIL